MLEKYRWLSSVTFILILAGCSGGSSVHPRVPGTPSDGMSFSAWVMLLFIGVVIVIAGFQKIWEIFKKK